MLKPIIDFFTEYLKNKPITDVLLICGLGMFVYFDYCHRETADKAHLAVRNILKERDEHEEKRAQEAERNADRIITALTGVKTEIKKTTAAAQAIPEATAVAAAKLVGGQTSESDAKVYEEKQ